MKMLRLFRLNLRAGLSRRLASDHELAFIEEVGVGLVAVIESLRLRLWCGY